ncbi:CLTH domain-containing protein/zf-RING_LisH domain-containing protein [Cephalotus follicularis]|uniref:CLTH domain-containing protein/zf-RING_LisH domain-containing protein n=1 Tax=Cephalotus follicularis TaxID=3775 RepID=A0A1Q3BA16_CEPFO|nr:CLTH domain-containing protein/zf-RING_LisH domain-containing protein [Cephalotus follicularis]
MELNAIKDVFDHVTKKQKVSTSTSQEVIEDIVQEIQNAIDSIKACPDSQLGCKSVLSELKRKLQEIAPLSQLEDAQKELNVALSKYLKVLDKSLWPDISKAYRHVEFDTHTINQIIASHFYRQGLFDIGDCFINESGETESDAASMRLLFSEMYQILEAMKGLNLEPALNWVAANSDKLEGNGSDLQLKLHSLQFVEILQNGCKNQALNYARTNFASFSAKHMAEIQKLMTCLLWAGKLDRCPYPEIMTTTNWHTTAEELTRQFCNFLGQSYESPLSVTIAAGIQGLPPLLKFMTLMTAKSQEWQSMKQLPVPVDLDKDFQFHSVFVCPVSKDQSTDENPPMLMTCGHVLCKQTINKMSKNSTKTFKCPYCPCGDIDAMQCRQLHF